MSRYIDCLLASRYSLVAARLLATFAFWASGTIAFAGFVANAAELEPQGLRPGWAFNAATIALQLIASAMIVCDFGAWLAAGALGVFTVLTIPIEHAFWRETGVDAFRDAALPVGVAGLSATARLL